MDIFTLEQSLSAASKYPITKLPETPISAPTRTNARGIRRTRRRLAFAGLRKRERRRGGWIGALEVLGRARGVVALLLPNMGMKDDVGRDAGM